ncbi:MAG: EamA family transporter [Gemmataceae bacterium]|nr:EamA family transporter [Gemmataceae bacterium]
MQSTTDDSQPAAWKLILAFATIYISWGTTYLAIQLGVKEEKMPPLMFGGSRLFTAGVVLLGIQAIRGQKVRLARTDLWPLIIAGVLLFVGGNGGISLAVQTITSGESSVLAATMPLFMGLLAMLWPDGDRLNLVGWLGLAVGFVGVGFLFAPNLVRGASLFQEAGAFLALASAALWALGSLILRHVKLSMPRFSSAAWQMAIGGGAMIVVGLARGEEVPQRITLGAFGVWIWLLVVGSWMGFVAFNWLLEHVSAARVGTYAYVNPLLAVLLGWAIHAETVSAWLLEGLGCILAGVFLVRWGEVHPALAVEKQDVVPQDA